MIATAAALALLLAASGTGQEEGPRFLGPQRKGPPQRVVTLAPSLTDTVLALGAGERLVGVSRFDQRPEVKSLPRVGGFVDPSVEAVIALKPDLVLVQPAPGNQKPVEKMAELGIPVLLLPLHSVDQVLKSIQACGQALGRQKEATVLAKRIQGTRERIRRQARTLKRPRVLFVYGYQPFIVTGPGSFADELLRDAGAINAAEKATSPYPVYSVESALRARVDVVVDAVEAHVGGGEKLRSLPGLKEARWVKLPSLDLLHPGPRLAEGLEELFRLLHPELAADAG